MLSGGQGPVQCKVTVTVRQHYQQLIVSNGSSMGRSGPHYVTQRANLVLAASCLAGD